jgi:Kef-type K+ transport system membrane component KefB
MPTDLVYIGLIFALFIVPKILQRFRLPSAITSLLLGVVVSLSGVFELQEQHETVNLLATFGISSLFLFAGLEIDVSELRKGAKILIQHLVIMILILAGVVYLAMRFLELDFRVSSLLALALLTPSAGFILDSLTGFNLGEQGSYWTRTKVIAAELLALAVLFVMLQSTSIERMALATLALAALVVIIPFLLKLFAVRIAPFAPRSEFAFLLMLAVVSAYITKNLGVYYLVGAFLVGMAARRFREQLPAMSSERMLHAIEAFASVFVPFYFFKVGLHLKLGDFGYAPLLAGLGFFVVFIPLRVGKIAIHQRLALKRPLREGIRVGTAMLPTLVFSLVLAEIIQDSEKFKAPSYVFGGIVIYALLNTLLPGLILKAPPPEFDSLKIKPPPPIPNTGPAEASSCSVTDTHPSVGSASAFEHRSSERPELEEKITLNLKLD